MYQTPASLGIGATGGILAATGANSLWVGLAAFAMISGAAAMLRIVPRRQDQAE